MYIHIYIEISPRIRHIVNSVIRHIVRIDEIELLHRGF